MPLLVWAERDLPVLPAAAASVSARPRSSATAAVTSACAATSFFSTWCLPQPRRPARRAGRLVRRPDGGGRDLRADSLVGYLASHRFVVRLLRALVLAVHEPRLQPGLLELQQRY